MTCEFPRRFVISRTPWTVIPSKLSKTLAHTNLQEAIFRGIISSRLARGPER